MKIKLTKNAQGRPVSVAYDHHAKKGVELDIQGDPGKWFVEVENLQVVADMAVNRGWMIEGEKDIALPVIPNDHGLYHPNQFIFEPGKGLKIFDPVIKVTGVEAPEPVDEEEEDGSASDDETDESAGDVAASEDSAGEAPASKPVREKGKGKGKAASHDEELKERLVDKANADKAAT